MKRNSAKKFSKVILSLFLVCILLVSLLALPATAATSQNGEEEFKKDYKTTDPKPTYTATLNKNNELLEKLTTPKKESKATKVLKKVKDRGPAWIKLVDSIVDTAKNDDADMVDWIDVGVDLLSTVAGIWGFDKLIDSSYEFIDGLLSSGNEPLSEVQVQTNQLMGEFDKVNHNLNDIKEELGALSAQVTDSILSMTAITQAQVNNLESKQLLREFTMSGDAGFSYLDYSNYLYGRTESLDTKSTEAYYLNLLEAISEDRPDGEIKACYDELFDSIYNNIGAFNQYYYGEVVGMENKSIVMHYYDYLAYNPTLISEGSTAEYEALLFALDVYTSYVYSYELLEMCWSYQLLQMKLSGSGSYAYDVNEAKVTENSIRNDYTKMAAALIKAEEQTAENIAYIMGMKDSYTVIDGKGDVYSIANYGDSFGNLADGMTVYMNVLSDELIKMFRLDPDKVGYYVNETPYIGEVKGVFDLNDIGDNTFTVTVKYGSEKLYSIDFTKIDAINNNSNMKPVEAFSGGSGTAEDPYLISNVKQFQLVEDDLNACYKLIADLDIVVQNPIGTEEKPFQGTFDGNGCTISNLTVESLPYDQNNATMTPTTGMFGAIGRKGVVKNLALEALTVSSAYEQDSVKPQNGESSYYIGGIAGINDGLISNCEIKGLETSDGTTGSRIMVKRTKEDKKVDSNVTVYVGGIAGGGSGVIEYCSVGSLAITAESRLTYNDSESRNMHALHVAGIAGTASNLIRYCRVENTCTLSAFARSETETKENEKPYLDVYVGGIVADEGAKEYISNVYSDCKIVQCNAEIWNEGEKSGKHRYEWDNVSEKQGFYYPACTALSSGDTLDTGEMILYRDRLSKLATKKVEEKGKLVNRDLTEAEIEEILLLSNKELKAKLLEEQKKEELEQPFLQDRIAENKDELFAKEEKQFVVNITLTDNVCDNNAKLLSAYTDKLIDEEKEIKNIQFKDETGKAVEANVVSYYGFNTYHESDEAQSITVKVFFCVGDVLLCDAVKLSVEGKKLVEKRVEGFENTFFKGADQADCLNIIFEKGFKLVWIYSNGQVEDFFVNASNRPAVCVEFPDTSEYGEKTAVIYCNDHPSEEESLKFEQTVVFHCDHTNADFELTEKVLPNCQKLGYEVLECGKGCGEKIYRNYVKGDHTYMVTEGKPATCQEAGYTQRTYCAVCGEEFEKDEWIQALPHDYVNNTDTRYKVDASYPASDYHYCVNGNHYEAHQYTVEETVDESGILVYLYTCHSCGYENPDIDDNIITNEKKEKTAVLVTDGYVLNVGDEVVTYVQILNNPGFKGATFGIRYDDGLELVSAEESNLVPQQLQVCHEVHNGYNFLWGDGTGVLTTEDGYLLKLTFRYVDRAKKAQSISVVYGMSNGSDGGFVTEDGISHKLMTRSGTVKLVGHLPGDVTGDGVVDIMDATYIAWDIVGKPDENGEPVQVNARYADVNLDGKVDLLDVLAILQSITGNYGTNLLSPDYQLFFQLNGFSFDGVDESVAVAFYNENGKHMAWNENADFDKYEALMKQLGYTFTGWYTRKNCTCEDLCTHIVDTAKPIAFDPYQERQTLYARWEKNRLVFDVNGANSGQIQDLIWDPHSPTANLLAPKYTPSLSYEVEYYVTNYEGTYATLPIYKEFEGWYIKGTDTKVLEFDLTQPNIGAVELVANWADQYQWEKPEETRAGYSDVTAWYYKEQYNSDTYKIPEINDTTIQNIFGNGQKLYGKENPVQYNITYVDKSGVTNGNDNTYFVTTDTFELKGLSGYTGYTFAGWYDEKGVKITEIKKGTYGNLTLTAKWDPHKYTIIYDGNGNTNKNFAMDNQEHVYGTSQELRENGYVCEYTVTYDYDYGGKIEKVTVKYQFQGWKDDAGRSYSDGQKVQNLTADQSEIKLIAQWKVVSVVLPNPTRTGHTFNGWYSGNYAGNGGTSYTPNADILLKAGWTAAKVSFDSAGGSACSPITIASDGTYAGLDNVVPTRTNDYEFLGWYYNGTKISSMTQAKVNGDHTLTAKWLKIAYAVNFTSSNGYRDKGFDFNDTHTDNIATGMSVSGLNAKYKTVEVKIVFDAQRYNRISNHNAKLCIIANGKELKSWEWDIDDFTRDDKGWTENIEVTYEINVSDLNSDGSFSLKWSCVDDPGEWWGTDDDGWKLGETNITVVAKTLK